MQNGINDDILGDVLAAVLVAFPLRFNVDRDSISFSDELETISNGDIYITSHTLMDIHQVLGLELNYLPFTEFDKFKTVKDVIEYFYNELMNK